MWKTEFRRCFEFKTDQERVYFLSEIKPFLDQDSRITRLPGTSLSVVVTNPELCTKLNEIYGKM